MVRGRLESVTSDDLTHFLNLLNVDVRMSVAPNPAAYRPAQTVVDGSVTPMAASEHSGRQEGMRLD